MHIDGSAVAGHTSGTIRWGPERTRRRRWPAAALVCTLIFGAVIAATQVPAGPGTLPPPDVPTGTIRNVAYGPDPAQRFDLYLPEGDRKAPAPLLIYLHGGGWVGGGRLDIEKYAAPIVRLTERGWAVASIDYRLAGSAPYPAQAQDLDRAMRWFLTAGVKRFPIDPSTMVVAGHSSGAHLALLAGLAPERVPSRPLPRRLTGVTPAPDAVIALAAPTSLADLAAANVYGSGADAVAALFGCPPTEPICDSALAASLDPVEWIDLADPPVLLVYGDQDGIVPVDPHGTRLLAAARAALPAGQVEWYVVRGDNHDLPNMHYRRIEGFVDRVLAQQ